MENLTMDEVTNKFDDFDPIEPLVGLVTQEELISVIKLCLNTLHPDIKPRKSLVMMTFHILKAYIIDGKRFVIAECPTGSGKTIIGFVVHFCLQYLLQAHKEDNIRIAPEVTSYFLTSNKVLQEQISNDISRFNFQDYMILLKGVNNYKCIEAHNRWKAGDQSYVKKVNSLFPDGNIPSDYEVTYNLRPCAGYSGKKLVKKFEKCVYICPYKLARTKAANKSCTILNYAYFLNVMRMVDTNPNTYFPRRTLTICDEAHLLPDIVCNMFNLELTKYQLNRIQNMCKRITEMFGIKTVLENYNNTCNSVAFFFTQPINQASEILRYLENLSKHIDWLKEIKADYKSESFNIMFGSDIEDIIESLEMICSQYESLKDLINNRPEDLFYESEQTSYSFGVATYKHIIKDLQESELIRTNMLDKIEYGLFMSATLGNIDEYATLMGIRKNEYTALRLPSTFDFSQSPIYLTKSGWLNYKNFDIEINKVLGDCIKICNEHQTEKGVIHTSTFKVTNLLREYVQRTGNDILNKRLLFYQNANEKEKLIEHFRNSQLPLILVGPSLYEGIDLPDDLCRFQILIKTPYAQINSYIKKKMKRYPFWYKRNCIEKIIQAIGRSNRHKSDWSKVYLLDNCFNDIIFETNDSIVNRIETRKIY